jgi:hypothetical protein
MVKDSNGKIQTPVERVDVVNHSPYNEKNINTNTGYNMYDTNYVYRHFYIYYLERISTFEFHVFFIQKKMGSRYKRG